MLPLGVSVDEDILANRAEQCTQGDLVKTRALLIRVLRNVIKVFINECRIDDNNVRIELFEYDVDLSPSPIAGLLLLYLRYLL